MWYTFSQNNSGGYYIENDYVGSILFIEALNQNEANDKMWAIVEDYSDWCPCCGERWDTPWGDDDEGTETPERYGKKLIGITTIKGLQDFMSWFGETMMFYFLDGSRMIVSIQNKKLSVRKISVDGVETQSDEATGFLSIK